jgi:rhamnulose-1-phosphate aldolase
MNVTDLGFIRGFIETADEAYRRGWHERNGGNLSYRLTPSDIEEARWCFAENAPWEPLHAAIPTLASEQFLVTGTGKYFRNIIKNPHENIGICALDAGGENYRILWGLEGSKPTSEFLSHLMNHAAKIAAKGDNYRVIYHCHPINIIALTFVLPLDEKVFTRELWEMITECAIVFPDGVGVMPWEVCGGKIIAEKSAALMNNFDVIIWAHHGIFCAGESLDSTFGLAETIEKAAEILLKILSVSPQKKQTISPQNLTDLAKAFNVNLPEKFLKGNNV